MNGVLEGDTEESENKLAKNEGDEDSGTVAPYYSGKYYS